MIKTDKTKIHKDWKVVNKIGIEKELRKELEDLLGRRLTKDDFDNERAYKNSRRSITKKKKKK